MKRMMLVLDENVKIGGEPVYNTLKRVAGKISLFDVIIRAGGPYFLIENIPYEVDIDLLATELRAHMYEVIIATEPNKGGHEEILIMDDSIPESDIWNTLEEAVGLIHSRQLIIKDAAE